jgi:tetratricopeptide (TPR) repeat protein
MNADQVPNWESVERQAVSLVDDGHRFQRLGQDEKALASFDKAVTICRGMSEKSDPVALALAQALDNKGNALVELERLVEAIPCFDEAIRIHEGFVRGDGTPQDVREIAVTVMNKGLALMLLGRNDEARACLERAIDGFERCGSREDYCRAWLNNAELYIRQKRFREALPAIDEAIAAWEDVISDKPGTLNADYVYTLYCRADVLLNLGCCQEALDFSDRAIALNRAMVEAANGPKEREDLAVAVNLRGDVLTKLGRTDEAQDCFREAAQLKGNADGLDGDGN